MNRNVWTSGGEPPGGAMLRGEMCGNYRLDDGIFDFPPVRGIPPLAHALYKTPRIYHIHRPINHMGYSDRLGLDFVIVTLN